MTATYEQLAQRQNLFRDANERIERAAAAVDSDGPRPYICECSLDACMTHVEVPADLYDRVRQHPARFLTLPGHELDELEFVAERGEGWQVVEKTNVAGQIAMQGDPRA